MPMAASPLNATRNCRSSSVKVLVVVRLSTYSRPEHPVGGGHERGAHGAPDALQQDRLAPEARVRRRVLRHDGHQLLHDLVGDRSRDLHRLRRRRGGSGRWSAPARPSPRSRSTMVTRSTLMISKVTSTTARSSRSRSSSAESFWETSSSIWSLSAWRASPVAASTLSWPTGGRSRLVMPGGSAAAHHELPDDLPAGADPPRRRGRGADARRLTCPGAVRRKTTLPKVIGVLDRRAAPP